MKKLLILVILAAMLCSIGIPASAASGTYELDELGLTVSIPADYWVITRDTPENSSVFSELGLTKAAMTELFETSNTYLNGISKTFSDEIVVTAADFSLSNLSWFNDSTLQEIAEAVVDVYIENGLQVPQYDIYQHHQTKFFRIYFTDAAQNRHSLQYYTVYDYKAISITMHSFAGGVTADQEAILKTVADSVQFGERQGDSVSGEDTEPFLYTDSESGVTFTVPANWKGESLSEGGAQFLYTKVDGYAMMYHCKDFWSEMTPEEKKGYTRADMDGSTLTYFEIAMLAQIPLDKISSVTYNGMEYLKYENTFTEEVYGVEATFTVTQLIYIENGWMYVFEFGGTSAHWLYADFESLVKSVKYPAVSTEAGSTPPNNPSLEYDIDYDTSYNNPGDILLVVLPIVAVVVIGVVIYRKIQEKRQEKMLDYGSPEPQPPIAAEQRDLCRKCGQKLPTDSVFCHFCGTKIERES